MRVSARRTTTDRRGRFPEAAFDEVSVLGFKSDEAGFEELAFGDDDDVESWRDLIPPKDLSYQSFSPVSLDRATQFFRRRYPEPSDGLLVRQQKEREIPAMEFGAAVVNLLEFGPPPDVLGRPKARRHSLLTVRRLRPFARRRLRTRRPFFVLILTRKPCVRFLRRVFG